MTERSHKVVRLWRDVDRTQQRARFLGLPEIAPHDKGGRLAWEEARCIYRQLPQGCDIMLPSARVFARVLGLMRSGHKLKNNPIKKIELSTQEIAECIGYSKSIVCAALRWLGCGPIRYRGEIVGRGIGWLHRGRRVGAGYLFGKLRRLYRTSVMVLTLVGSGMLGLAMVGDLDEKPKPPRRQWNAPVNQHVITPQRHRLSTGPPEIPTDTDATEFGRSYLRRIQAGF